MKMDKDQTSQTDDDLVMIPCYLTPAALVEGMLSRFGIALPTVAFEEAARSALLDYAVERKSIIEAKVDILRHFTAPQTERQGQILADYIEELLTEVKYDRLPVDLAVIGLAEVFSGSFS